ncbi:sugar phosphate nucleotidyltransferase [Paenibacillus swuensis]|uniref:sugar phosphate nucleotidyltransferase n=1 Tax=Paenibacillus swuensis TaxID=1178515 RepID=UPI000838EFA5|nr:sugar phosphate nucleotidyltransferase [Paenibacillus swuensis]
MKIILLSGGTGKRLWPLSTKGRSKQYMKLLTGSDETSLSMAQQTMRQLEKLGLAEDVVVATTKNQLGLLYEQLGSEIRTVVEPERRDTYPAVLLAAAYLHSVLHTPAEETIVVLPIDHMADANFYRTLYELEAVIRSGKANLCLIGTKPSAPLSKYGYMVPLSADEDERTDKNDSCFPIHSFVEKPDEDTAERLIAQGALWNCGIFAFRLSYMINRIPQHDLEPDYETLKLKYHLLPSASFDVQVVEHETRLAAIRFIGRWGDIGTWDALVETLDRPVLGNGLVTPDCAQTQIVNELSIPVLVSGISDAVVVAGSQGILVTARNASAALKPWIDAVTQASPAKETTETVWPEHVSPAPYQTNTIHLFKGQLHGFSFSDSWITIGIVVSGQGIAREAKDIRTVCTGQTFYPSHSCTFEPETDCIILEVLIFNEDRGEVR